MRFVTCSTAYLFYGKGGSDGGAGGWEALR
jgi:hypothetical protein